MRELSGSEKLTDLLKVFQFKTSQARVVLKCTKFCVWLTLPHYHPTHYQVLSAVSLEVTNITTSHHPHHYYTSPSLHHVLLGLLKETLDWSVHSTMALLYSIQILCQKNLTLIRTKVKAFIPAWKIFHSRPLNPSPHLLQHPISWMFLFFVFTLTWIFL